ncbi:Hypothetical protein RLITU_0247 [Romboutsia lituseburensis]|uniref:Uncharacterized protein n=1 Tax=Romboutsia lituseburensis DSM 797 TaxID=1121325 RepID=A0A1G9S0D5_9FIRM|nr:Hypothetical protein RLITU_0247 [Romboutsia lituseburensis]SDM28205.1 hypothetical protein SAMN04515677_10813 [Romboutsia lituseburensis DSM 797]
MLLKNTLMNSSMCFLLYIFLELYINFVRIYDYLLHINKNILLIFTYDIENKVYIIKRGISNGKKLLARILGELF